MSVRLRNATFTDAKAIDAIVAGFDELGRDLNSWVNQAEAHITAVDGDELIGFAARRRHVDHPARDLVAIHVLPHAERREIADALLTAIRPKKKALKLRLPADDVDGEAIAVANGFTRRIVSSTYRVDRASLDGDFDAIEYDLIPNDVLDGFRELYLNTHRWDPPRYFSRRYLRKTLLAGSAHVLAIRDDDGVVVAVGAAHRSEEPGVAADIALAGAIEPDRPDADELTRRMLAGLASRFDDPDDGDQFWFEVDDGHGANGPLHRVISATSSTPRESVAIFTSD